MATKDIKDMTQQEAKSFYADKVSKTLDLSKLKPKIDANGNPGGYEYGGAPAFVDSDGTIRVAVSDVFDPSYAGGVNGLYTANYSPNGTYKEVGFTKADRGGGFIADNLSWLGPLLVGGAAALGAFMSPAAAASAATSGAVAEAAPITQSQIAALGSAATPADLAASIQQILAGGSVPSGFAQALAKLPASLVKAAGALLPAGAKTLLNAADTLLGNGTGDFSNLANLIGAGTAANELIGASNTAAADYNTLGNDQANEFYSLFGNIDNRTQGIGNDLNQRYQNLGNTASGMLGNLAAGAKTDYTNLGTTAAGVYNGIASGTKSAYDNLLTDVKGTTEKFTPWNVTTNLGSTNKGVFTPTAGTQNVSDQATAAAGSSFGAANDIDVNNLAAQKFAQQQAMLSPYDAQDLAKLRANLAATGRTGVASNATGQAISPELAAYYLSKGTRDAGLLTNADQAALNVRSGLVNQGVAASGVPNSIASQGLQQVTTGVNAGATQANTNNNLGQMLGSLGARGIDAVTQAQTHGADSTLPIFDKAIGVPLGLQKEGIGTMLSQGNLGLGVLADQLNRGTNAAQTLGTNAINARGTNYAQAIATRYQGRKDKAVLLARLFQQLGAMTPANRQAVNNAVATGDVASLTQALLDQGMSPNQVAEVITGGTGGGDLGSGTYSIWSPDGSPDMGGGSGASDTTFGSMFGFY